MNREARDSAAPPPGAAPHRTGPATSRETCSEVLPEMEGRGLLRVARGRVAGLDRERIQDAAG